MSSSRDHRKQLYERLVGQTVANERFEITRLLGFGGMGAVYEAIQKNMNRKVALKLIPTHDPTIVARFEREALTISKLQHPNTITVFDFGQSEDGFLFLSMELLEGQTLTDAIKTGPMPAERAVHIASQMCRSLAEAHRAGIVHRDIKPDNIILIRVDDDPDVVKVLDFGIAKAVMGEDDVQLTGDGRIIGTPRYMSPEQILAEPLDHRSDIYSLGCILFEMLCGAPPFQQSSTTALMISHTQEPPPAFAAQLDTGSMSMIPGGLEHVVRRALAKSPNDRPRDCDQLREELEAAMKGLLPSPLQDQDGLETVGGIPALVHSPAQTSNGALHAETGAIEQTPSSGGNKLLIIGIIALALVVTGLIAFNALKPEEAPDETAKLAEAPKPVEPEPEPEPVVAPPPAPVGEAVAFIQINTDPPGARVYEGKTLFGTSPVKIPVKAELSNHTYRLVLKEHEEVTIGVGVTANDKDQTIERSVTLEPIEKEVKKPRPVNVARPKPKPDPKPDPKPTPQVDLLDDGPKADVKLLTTDP